MYPKLLFSEHMIILHQLFKYQIYVVLRMVTNIDVLWPRLGTRQAKWAERPPKVMQRSKRLNKLQICPRRDSNTGGSDMWSNTPPLDHGGSQTRYFEMLITLTNVSLSTCVWARARRYMLMQCGIRHQNSEFHIMN